MENRHQYTNGFVDINHNGIKEFGKKLNRVIFRFQQGG
jgi:hypothetical protein